MARRLFTLILSSTCIAATACAPSLDIPPPPNLDPLLVAYEAPTANVRVEVMREYGDVITRVNQQVSESNIALQFLDIIDRVLVAVDDATDDDGTLSIGGLRAQGPDGLVTIEHTCTGWDPDPTDDPTTNGTIELQMPIASGRLGPVVWGTSERCRYLVEIGSRSVRTSYDGEVAVHFGVPVELGRDVRRLAATFLINGNIGLADDVDVSILQSFRVQEGGPLEILVQLGNEETFVYFLAAGAAIEGIRDRTGTFACSLEQRECVKDSETFSW